MTVTDRIIRIVHVAGVGLLASDAYGRIHLLDEDLHVIRSSPFVRHGRPLYGIAVSGGWVIGKDRLGAIMRWSLDTLELVDRLDPATVCDRSTLRPREEPSPISSRGIAIWQGRVYISAGYHRQMLILDLETFEVVDIIPNLCGESPMEWASTEHPTRHAISDRHGNLRFGSFDSLDFPTIVNLDDGNIHRVRYDARHDRFWATQDMGNGDEADVANGIVVVDMNGVAQQQLLFARNDVEFLSFSPDYRRAYSGGFDSQLVVFDNTTPDLTVERIISGFPHQLSDLTVAADGTFYALSQDGEIVKFDEDGQMVTRLGYARQAVWDIQQSPADPDTLLCATDSGVAEIKVRHDFAGPRLDTPVMHDTGYGFTRRVVPLESGWIGISRDRKVFRCDPDGSLLWTEQLGDLVHTVAVNPTEDRVLVATDAGALEFDAYDGSLLETFGVDGMPVWSVAYLPDGNRVVITRSGLISVLDGRNGGEVWRFDQGDYPKRAWAANGNLYVTGDGGLKEIEVGAGVTGRWFRLLSNTVENAVLVEGMVLASSYDMQIAAYDYETSALIGLLEDLPDYPKSLRVLTRPDGRHVLIVGHRGGLLSTYLIDRTLSGMPLAKLRDTWLPRRVAPFQLLYQDRPSVRELTAAI